MDQGGGTLLLEGREEATAAHLLSLLMEPGALLLLPPRWPGVEALLQITAAYPTLLQPHGLQATRLLCPWDFPGKSTGVGCHRLLQMRYLEESNS